MNAPPESSLIVGPPPRRALRDWVMSRLDAGARTIAAADQIQSLDSIAAHTVLPQASALIGKNVLVRTASQLAAAIALVELDGVAARLIVCPPDLDDANLQAVAANANIDAIVCDGLAIPSGSWLVAPLVPNSPAQAVMPGPGLDTQWVLFTSGTTGVPKMVAHQFAGLTGAIAAGPAQTFVWATFYDIRRYGGLQILLRALLGGGSMVLSQAGEAPGDFLERLVAQGATHISGTPSHWRRALMSPLISRLRPHYIRLSGEIADQAVLDRLQATFPGIPIGHAYASTEAGVGFEVRDGLEGFPADMLENAGEVEMKVVDGALHLRSRRAASAYVGPGGVLRDADGFVDTGDLVERRGGRFYFMGRASGVVNVGGLKVHPEEVEAVINAHPGVRLSRVRARKSPIMGAIVMAEVVAREAAQPGAALKDEILAACRDALAAHKVPASLVFVEGLPLTPGGKLERRLA